jgi:hypothetical protein
MKKYFITIISIFMFFGFVTYATIQTLPSKTPSKGVSIVTVQKKSTVKTQNQAISIASRQSKAS